MATLTGYVIAFALLAQVLKMGLPVGVAYGIWAAAGVALTAVAGRLPWADPLTPAMAIGIIRIDSGVLLVEIGSEAAADRPSPIGYDLQHTKYTNRAFRSVISQNSVR